MQQRSTHARSVPSEASGEVEVGQWQGEQLFSARRSATCPSLPASPPPPARPNTDPRTNSPINTSSMPTVSSALNISNWDFYLRDYPDRDFVTSLLQIIKHGANVGFSGDRVITLSELI